MACPLASERVWLDKHQYDAAERRYYETLSGAKLQENGMKVEPAVAPVPEKAPQPSGESKKPNKKNKNQKNKQLNKQSESVQSVEEEPVQAAPKVEEKTSSNKKKKAKKPANKEKAATEETNVQIRETVEVKVVAEEPPKTKEGKEKKNKADKKKANNNNKAAEEPQKGAATPAGNTLVSEIAKARQHIKDSLERMDGIAALASTPGAELLDRLATVERENSTLRQTISKLENLVLDLTKRVNKLEGGSGAAPKPVAAAPAAASKDDDDDGVDLFASDEEEEDAAAAKVREERLAAYNAKKSKKPVLIAKSNLILDVKCWDDETDMKELEAAVRGVTCEGLLWGASKLVPLAYGIQKLQISCVVEDEKVSIDWLVDEIQAHEDFVQSVDIAAFNKI